MVRRGEDLIRYSPRMRATEAQCIEGAVGNGSQGFEKLPSSRPIGSLQPTSRQVITIGQPTTGQSVHTYARGANRDVEAYVLEYDNPIGVFLSIAGVTVARWGARNVARQGFVHVPQPLDLSRQVTGICVKTSGSRRGGSKLPRRSGGSSRQASPGGK